MSLSTPILDVESLGEVARAEELQPRAGARTFVEFKHAADVTLAVTLLVLFLPFLLFVGLLIELTSAGPAMYVQWRVGRRGKLFRMFKLRTMVEDAELSTGPVWAQSNDPRVTRIGRFLRDTHLDELPQLINVIKGEMSLVGPRPERPLFVRELTQQIPNYAVRLQVRPGVTGLAQVCHGYDASLKDVKRKLAYDLLYIRRMSWMVDLKILVATAGKALPLPVRQLA